MSHDDEGADPCWYAELESYAKGKTMNSAQRDMARHALGLPNRKNETYRNHYCIGPQGEGYHDWEDMVDMGLAIKLRRTALYGGDDIFLLTKQGAIQVLESGEKLSDEDFKS